MADQKITALDALLGANVADNDVIPIVDVSDTTMAASGTNKKISRSELINALAAAFQPLDSDLTAIAALSTTLFGRSLLALADAAALRSTAGVVIGTDVQAYDSDLAAIAALSTTSFGRTFLTLVDQGAARTAIGTYSSSEVDSLVNATAANVGKRARVRAATTANITIASDLNNGDTIDGVTLATGDLVLVKNQSTAADNGVYVVGVSPARFVEFDTYDEHPGSLIAAQEGSTNADTLWLCTSNTGGTLGTTAIAFTKLVVAGELLAANNLSDLASASSARSNLGLAIGTDVQAYDADLSAIAALVSAANKLPYATGTGTWALTDLTAAGRALIDDADKETQRGTLGLGSIATYSASSLTTNGVVYGSGASAIASTSAGTSGEALISAGSGAAPAYGSVVDVQYVTTTGDTTWYKPANAKAVFVMLMGGGGSGGAGEKIASTTATNSGGGGGGGSGGLSMAWYDAASLGTGSPLQETVTVGAGGAAPGTTTTVGAGADGNAGGDSKFTVGGVVRLFAGGGAGGGGGGGTAAGGAGYGGLAGGGPLTSMYLGASGGKGAGGVINSNAETATAGVAPAGAGGGGGGGGSSATTGRTAGAGGASMPGTGTTGTGIAGGAAGAGGGGNGGSPAAIGNAGFGNSGGGGGGQRTTAGNGGAGGTGGTPGGGGGGGGNGIGASGTNSNGNGGAGGRGFALIITVR